MKLLKNLYYLSFHKQIECYKDFSTLQNIITLFKCRNKLSKLHISNNKLIYKKCEIGKNKS